MIWLSRLLLIVLSVSLPLIALELALRTVGPVLPGNYPGYLYLEPHPVYGFFHVPSSSGWLKTSEYAVRVDINPRGLRERDIGYTKPSGIRRVVVIGDSFVEGAQVASGALMTTQLESMLSQHAGARYEVIDAGVSAWGTDQEYLFLKTEALRYQPELVIAAFYTGNDVTNNSNKIKRPGGVPRKPYFELSNTGELRMQAFVPRAPRQEGAVDQLRRGSLLFALLDQPARQLTGMTMDDVFQDEEAPERQLVLHELPVYSERSSGRWEEAWRLTEALIVAMRDEAQRAGARFLLVNVPTKWEIYADDWQQLRDRNGLPATGWDLNGPGRRLQSIAERDALDYLDLRPSLESAAQGPRLYYSTDIHWTAAGHAQAARAIAEAVDRLSQADSSGLATSLP